MTTSPRAGFTDLVAGQAVPEVTVNEMGRRTEQGAGHYIFKDRDLATPPGSPADGDCYLVAASPTGAWTGHAGDIAFYMNTAWEFIEVIEGYTAWVNDENVLVGYDGAAWGTLSSGAPASEATNSQVWVGSSSTTYISPNRLYSASAPVALTSSATITPDGNNGFNFSLTLAHNATLANPSNFKVGQSGAIVITQDGTGGRTLVYGTDWKFPSGAPVLSTAIGAIDVLSYFVSASSVILCNLSKAYTS